mmetsp:Transcript_1537/g.4993  ORF Transcript_1537/g.4993 Transcript_1537/m.4993 type:complete len:88 (-) Transcript_1537:163-426(-)
MAGDSSAPSRFRFAEQKAKAQVEAGRRDSAKGRKGSILGKVIRSASFDSAQKREEESRRARANWKRSINTVIASIRWKKIIEEKREE